MKCECSLNNNYEVIGLCDKEEFNEKIMDFSDGAYTQINTPQQVIIPENFPTLNYITKTHLNIKIRYTKIIDTPSSSIKSVEGFNLTGKMLLVYGDIEQKIIYTTHSDNSKHSIIVNTSFSTHIVLDENANKSKDTYCIYPYVEDVSLIVLGERSIQKNISLFLFAHKIMEIEKLSNTFIFKTFDTNQEMTRIEFNKTNKRLIVTSTEKNYNNGTITVFYFLIKDSSQTKVKGFGNIRGNENANEFKSSLNNLKFEYGDLITLGFSDKSKVYLTNYPNKDDIYNMLSLSFQGFKITQEGIIPYVLPNDIMLNNSFNNSVVKIQFDILNKKFLINASRNIANPGGADYFKMTLYRSDGVSVKISSSIAGNSNAYSFSSAFLGKDFEYGDLIKLEYEERLQVVISNFPDSKTPIYNPIGREEKFKITENGLISAPKSLIIDKLSNSFIFKTYKTNEEMAKVEFDKTNKRLIVTSTNRIYDNGTKDVFTFKLIDSSKTEIKGLGILKGDKDASLFKLSLNDVRFEYEDLINLGFESYFNVILDNYPKVGDSYSMLTDFNQGFKITQNGIIPYILPNDIILNDSDDNIIVKIQFDILNKKFLIYVTGYETDLGGENYFKLTLYDNNGTTEKISYNIPGGSSGDEFETHFFSEDFEFGNIIKLEYEENNKVVITNYPNSSTTLYNPKGAEELFKITLNGLIPFNT